MINATTGEISFESPAAKVGPDLSSASLKDESCCLKPKRLVWNDEHETFAFREVSASTQQWAGRLWFHKGKLREVYLTAVISSDAQGWSGWSKEDEGKRKLIHDAVLQHELGNPDTDSECYIFDWGSVSSITDPREHITAISITYK